MRDPTNSKSVYPSSTVSNPQGAETTCQNPEVAEESSFGSRLCTLGFQRQMVLSLNDCGSGNCIIHGENLGVLKALRLDLAGAIRCIYLDPPYNNQESYNHYTDELSHEVWLDQLSQRLSVFIDLLTEDGSIWISIDDREMHYLKVEADKVFGRTCLRDPAQALSKSGWRPSWALAVSLG